MHVITAKLATRKIERMIARLTESGYTQTHYEIPLDVVTDDNGYDFIEKPDELTELNIYVDNFDEAKDISNVAELLNIDKTDLIVSQIETENYQQSFEDIFLENGWVITTPENKENYNDEKRIVLDSQGNFGTGYHVTTRTCLHYILMQDFTEKSVADIGAGSGVLSVAAAIKGAASIDSFDIQPVEREILYQFELNGLNHVNVIQADLINSKNTISKRYDWVFLNIGTQENIDILKAQSLLDHKETTFLISGMLVWNAHRVIAHFQEAGFTLEEKKQTEEWVTCLFKKA